jgi:gamma-glutamylcyclotransferase (GGCT)/AIG2-like uncharacterized protein YtfP
MLPFFVYGTLLPDQPNFHVWAGTVVKREAAVFPNGRLYDLGAFPMLLEEGIGVVRGMVLTVDPKRYDQTLTALDQLEGCDPAAPERSFYLRRRRTVYLAHGEPVAAWVYLGRRAWVNGRQPVPHDSWLAYTAGRLLRQGKSV